MIIWCPECWKWHFRASRFQNFLGEHAPRPPLPRLMGLMAPCSYSRLFFFNQLPTSNFIETPGVTCSVLWMNRALTSTEFSCPWFSVTVPPSRFRSWRLWKTFSSFKLPIFRHLNSRRCKHSAVGTNVIINYRHRMTTKTEVLPSVRIFSKNFGTCPAETFLSFKMPIQDFSWTQ